MHRNVPSRERFYRIIWKGSSFLKGGWLRVENNKAWYLFDKDGYMLTGLQDDANGQRYVL